MPHPAITADRTAVITGGASGIGLAAAQALGGMGMAIALIDLPGQRLDTALADLRASGITARAFGLNVGDFAAMQNCAAEVARDLPPVTVLMNNAGYGEASSTLRDIDAFTRTLQTNLFGIVHGTMAFSPAMIAHGQAAVIINTGSKQGITTPPGNPAYNVSKAGVKSYTEALAHELRNLEGGKVTAHLLIPGWVHTGLTAAQGAPKPDGAWTAAQTVDFLLSSLDRGDFYILCPDNDVPRALDEKRIAWAAGDLIENRPALSRWHPDFAEAFKTFLDRR